jgi:hypothetical protein
MGFFGKVRSQKVHAFGLLHDDLNIGLNLPIDEEELLRPVLSQVNFNPLPQGAVSFLKSAEPALDLPGIFQRAFGDTLLKRLKIFRESLQHAIVNPPLLLSASCAAHQDEPIRSIHADLLNLDLSGPLRTPPDDLPLLLLTSLPKPGGSSRTTFRQKVSIVSPTQSLQVFVCQHPSIHHHHPLRFLAGRNTARSPKAFIELLQKPFHRLVVPNVSVIGLIPGWPPLGGDRHAKADLLTVRPMVAGIAPLGFRNPLRPSLKVRA